MENTEEKIVLSKADLEQIKKAAKEGAKEGVKGMKVGRSNGIFSGIVGKVLSIILIVVILAMGVKILNPFQGQGGREKDVANRDLTLENDGLLGYTAADFSEAILGKKEHLSRLEVLEQNVSDVVTVTDTGLGNLKVFTKTQLITYQGTAVFTVDLSNLSEDDFQLDEEKQILTIYIPHTKMSKINAPAEDMKYGETKGGLLAFGDIKMTAEENNEIEKKAVEMMKKKIKKDNVQEDADRLAKLAVWELYQPVVNSVTTGYSLDVKFVDEKEK